MRIRRHLSYATVTATLALFLALAGGAYAVGKVRSRDIANGRRAEHRPPDPQGRQGH